MPMHSADKDKVAARPVVLSQAAALREINYWLAENQLTHIRDGDGWTWTLTVRLGPEADPKDPRRVLWQGRVLLTTEMTAADLIRDRVLDETEDARLLSLVGEARVPLAMKPILHTAVSEAEARSLLTEALPKIKDTFAHYHLAKVKRALVGRFVEEVCIFDRARV